MKSRKGTKLFCSLLCASLLLTLASPAAFAQEPAETVLPAAGASPQLAGCPSSIGFGETIQCSIDSSGEVDTYSFSANAGDKVLVRMTGLSGIVWPKISVKGPDETSLCETWAFSTAEIASCSLGATGDYAILSSNDWEGETGGYSLYVQRLNNPGSSVSIAFGQTLSASLDSVAEIDTYTFAANAGDRGVAQDDRVTRASSLARI